MKIIRIVLAISLLMVALAENSEGAILSLEGGGFQTGAIADQNTSHNSQSNYSQSYSASSASVSGGGEPVAIIRAASGYLGSIYNDPGQIWPPPLYPTAGGYSFTLYSTSHAGNGDVNPPCSAYGSAGTYDPLSQTNFITFQVIGTSTDSSVNGVIILSFITEYWFVRYRDTYPTFVYYYPIIITVNGITEYTINPGGFIMPPNNVEGSMSGSIEIPVTIGDIIGINSQINTNVNSDGISAGDMEAFLQVSLSPVQFVPLPPTVFLLGSGLLGLGAWGRFRKS